MFLVSLFRLNKYIRNSSMTESCQKNLPHFDLLSYMESGLA